MPNYTENLNLEQPLDSEQYDVGVTRRNNQKIDDFAETMPKLYTATGQNTDGAMTQKASSDLFGGKVNKAGDLMTGNLRIDNDNTPPSLYLRNTNESAGTTPSSQLNKQVIFQDSNGTTVGYVANQYNTNGGRVTTLNCRNANATDNANIAIGYDSNGNLYTIAPTPSLNSNSTNIATTEFIKKYIQCGTFNIAPNAETTVNFSTAFPNQYIALAFARVSESTQTTGVTYPMIRALYTGSFRVYNPSSGNVTYTWIAVWRG